MDSVVTNEEDVVHSLLMRMQEQVTLMLVVMLGFKLALGVALLLDLMQEIKAIQVIEIVQT